MHNLDSFCSVYSFLELKANSFVILSPLEHFSFPYIEQEFSKFSKTDKSLKHELGSIERSLLLPVSSWKHVGYYTRGGGSKTPFLQKNSTNSVDSSELI